MTKSEVLAMLEEKKDERGIAHWKKMENTGGLSSCGVGLTKLRKMAKEIGKSHELAAELWATNHHEAKIIALLIDDPKKITRAQIEAQVEEVEPGMLAHVFSVCGATLPKAPFALEVAKEWMVSKDMIRKNCGYGLMYELAKNKRHKELTDEFLEEVIQRIEKNFSKEILRVQMAMATALMGIGMRSKDLNKAAIPVAKKIGPITHSPTCDPFDVLKHLTGDTAKKKLEL